MVFLLICKLDILFFGRCFCFFFLGNDDNDDETHLLSLHSSDNDDDDNDDTHELWKDDGTKNDGDNG